MAEIKTKKSKSGGKVGSTSFNFGANRRSAARDAHSHHVNGTKRRFTRGGGS